MSLRVNPKFPKQFNKFQFIPGETTASGKVMSKAAMLPSRKKDIETDKF